MNATTRCWVAVVVMVIVAAACSGGEKIGGSITPGSSAVPVTTSDACATTQLASTDIGVTPETITVSVIADTGSPLRPGAFQGSVDAIEAWAKYINEHGGLACRRVAVKTYDSYLTADDAKNSVTSACANSLALVGTTALFLDDMGPAEQCKDATGRPTGIPDLAVLQTSAAQQCSRVSFSILPLGGECPYRGSGVRTFRLGTTAAKYYLEKYGPSLHGLFLVPTDIPSAITASTPYFAMLQKSGITRDAEDGISVLTPQSGYATHARALSTLDATFARNGADYVSNVFFRKEAQVQGVNTVKVWDCSLQCYDPRFISTGGDAVEDHYVWLSFLPFEDKGHNAELDNFLRYDRKPDAFGAQAWAAGQALATAVKAVVAERGANGVTRAALFDAIRELTNFDANGFLTPTNIGGRVGSPCLIGMQVKNGAFVRVDPIEPGTFDCTAPLTTLRLDPVKAYEG